MERDSTKTIFGADCPKTVINPVDHDAGGRLVAMPAGKPVTPRVLVRQVLTEALTELGGTRWLVDFVKRDDANARVFFQGLTKLLPTELTGPGGAPLTIVVRHEHGEIEGALIDGTFVRSPAEPEHVT